MKNILLIGCGGHARSVIDIIESSAIWNIYGLVGKKDDVNKDVLGYKVLGTDDDLSVLFSACPYAIIAIGQIADPTPRLNVAKRLDHLGFHIPTIISAKATVSRHSFVDRGTVVGHNAIINAGASVGSHSIINSQALVEHDASIGSFVHLSTGVIVNGGSSIGSYSFVGSGSIIREGIALPEFSTISAGKRIMGWPLK